MTTLIAAHKAATALVRVLQQDLVIAERVPLPDEVQLEITLELHGAKHHEATLWDALTDAA